MAYGHRIGIDLGFVSDRLTMTAAGNLHASLPKRPTFEPNGTHRQAALGPEQVEGAGPQCRRVSARAKG
jgi:hypothetical protein